MAQNEEMKKKLKKKRNQELFEYFKEISQKEGFVSAVKRTLRYFKRRYGKAKGRFLPKKSELARQREYDTAGWPKISICVPVFNPSRQFLMELIDSVVAQSYPNWELCLADASDDPSILQEILSKYADSRILSEAVINDGIAENTNRAIRMASGHYIAFTDHDDVLSPNALFEMGKAITRTNAGMLYSDEALFSKDYMHPSVGHFKPDYSPQYLLNCNYIGHLVVVRKDLVSKVGMLNKEYDGSQDYDLNLKVLDEIGAAVHIPKVLYYWRQHEESTSTGVEAKPYVAEAAKKAIAAHLERNNIRGQVEDGKFPSTYKVNYAIVRRPLVSIIIPNSEHIPDLDRCIRSIYDKTHYQNFELIVVENNSRTIDTFSYYERLVKIYPDCKVLVYEEKEFNFSKICNFGRQGARGEYLLFLNNDTEVITPGWMDEMLQLCQLEDVGAVGAMLYYPDDTVQHAGIVIGLGGYAGHSHKYALRDKSGYMFRQACVQEFSAVTGACMMVKADVFDKVGGFDPGFAVAYNDVDLCLRIRRRGQSIVFTPYAELYHHESKSRGSDEDEEKAQRFAQEQERLMERYGEDLLHDPYYNPNLTYDREDFSENDVLPEA